MKTVSALEIEDVRNVVQECAELCDGIRAFLQEDNCSGTDGLWHVCKVLHELSEKLTEEMHEAEELKGGADND